MFCCDFKLNKDDDVFWAWNTQLDISYFLFVTQSFKIDIAWFFQAKRWFNYPRSKLFILSFGFVEYCVSRVSKSSYWNKIPKLIDIIYMLLNNFVIKIDIINYLKKSCYITYSIEKSIILYSVMHLFKLLYTFNAW